ncbi:MAG: NHL repeat-containing protein [Candidatus Zixiibacteriota bacterium]
MAFKKLVLLLTAGWLLITACSKPPSDIQENAPVAVPLAMLVEREISGTVLGQSLKTPMGITVDYQGQLYVCDAGNNRLLRFDEKFMPQREYGGYGSLEGLFNHPGYIVIDNGLNLWVADVGNRRLSRHNRELNFVDEIKLVDYDEPLKYGEPSGIALTPYGEIWMCDREKGRLAIFDNVGQFDRFIGEFGYSGGQLLQPEKIISDSHDNFIVCDAGNRRIAVYDRYGNFSYDLRNNVFDYPVAAAAGNDGNLWVVDKTAGRVYLVSRRGEILFETGPSIPGVNTPLKNPSDIIVLKDGRLIISDSGNNRLLVCQVMLDKQ